MGVLVHKGSRSSVTHGCTHSTAFWNWPRGRIKQARGRVLCTQEQPHPSLARKEAVEGQHLHSWRLKSLGAFADQSLMVFTVLFLYPGTGVS